VKAEDGRIAVIAGIKGVERPRAEQWEGAEESRRTPKTGPQIELLDVRSLLSTVQFVKGLCTIQSVNYDWLWEFR
jgi:hypothetical protein